LVYISTNIIQHFADEKYVHNTVYVGIFFI